MESPKNSAHLIIQAVDMLQPDLLNFRVVVLHEGERLGLEAEAISKTSGLGTFTFSLQLLRDGLQINREVTQIYRDGQVLEHGLEPNMRYRIVVICDGYEIQEREVVLHVGVNIYTFFLIKQGSRFYWRGGVKIPFQREERRVVVLDEPREKMSAEGFALLLGKQKTFQLRSMGEAENAKLRGVMKDKLERNNPVKPWHLGFIRAELYINTKGAARKGAMKKLHKALQKQPGAGRLAIILREGDTGATMYAGEILLRFNKDFDVKEIDKLCRTYGLKLLGNNGIQHQFSVIDGPDVDFDELLNRILSESDKVVTAEPVLEEVAELYTRVVPQDFLFGLQWDHQIIQTPEAWWDLQQHAGGVANQYGRNSIVVGVSDTQGVDVTHQDLSSNVNGVPKILASFDFIAFNAAMPASFPGTHGTSCSGAATANADTISVGNPAFREGTAGSAPGCRLVAVRNSPGNGQMMYNWYVGLRVPSPGGGLIPPATLAIPVDVSSNSTGGPGTLTAVEIMFLEYATDFGRLGRGIPLCYAAGNSNGGPTIASTNRFATYTRVICVSASSLNAMGTIESRATYSCWGPENDVCAPSHNSYAGGGILHAPPARFGAVTVTVRNATPLAIGVPREGNLPGSPGRIGGINIQDNIALLTPAGSATLQINNAPVPFAGTTAVLVENVNTQTVEGLQVTGTVVGPPHLINVQFDTNFPNTQQNHNLGVSVQGGVADYVSSFGGTSYATPLATGVIALMLSAKNTLSWVEALHLLRTSARKLNVGENNPNGLWFDGPAMLNQVLNAALTDVVPKVPAVSTTLSLNVNAPADPLWHKNFGISVIKVASMAGFEVGDAISISQGATREFRVIEKINTTTKELTIDALRNNFTTAGAGTTIVAGGVKPVFSQFYGFGRINAAKAVIAARTYNHLHRDLVIRNTMTDTGLADIIAPATQIHSPDIWLRNQADPAMPAPPYNQAGPHQNPQTGVNRFIYARIKNIGSQESNLDAWVHFYVALSDHNAPPADPNANPTNITTPFLFPGDFNSLTPLIVQKSWCDNANNNITPVPFNVGITSGNQMVYHVHDNTVVNLFNPAVNDPNIFIAAGTISKADPNNINTGVTVVRAQWNAADLPPAGTAFGIYLLVYVSPVDGARQGREAGRNNNMSYREIAFADFSLLDAAGAVQLPSSVNVDEFGTPVTTNFTMRVQQSIGSMQVDRVLIEVSRTSDNGTVERGFFRNTGGVWQMEDSAGNAGMIVWATMNAPVNTGTAVPSAGNQTDISFTGTFTCALQHHKVSFRGVIHSARAGAVLVPIAEESFDIEVFAAVPATPSAAATDPAPPVPDSYVFTDFASLTTQAAANKSFGPVSADEFRITSVFTAAVAPKAYALCSGVVMVQVVDANRVNLVLRPMKQAGLGMTPVKYYIYRGLRKDDFFNAANTEVRPAAGAKDFVARLWPIFLAQNTGAPPFPAKALGWDPATQLPTDKIDEYFFASGSSFQYALAKAGEYLADFYHTGNSEFGFEIVLEEGTAQPTFANVRLSEYIVNVGAMPTGTAAQIFSKKLAREEILNYLDPAAFYGMHFAGTVRQKPAGTWTGRDIVTNVVDKFFTKRAVYLDIRNENGNSYNFYENYHGPAAQPDTGKNLRHGVVAGALTAVTYGANSWPIQILNLTHATANLVNPLVINLRWDDNLKPVLYVEHGTITSANINNRFADEIQLFTQPRNLRQPWTNDGIFTSPNVVGAGPNKDSIAWLFKLHYGRIIDATTVWPPTVVKTEKTTDNLFGPIDLNALWSGSSKVKWIAARDRKYVDGQAMGFGQMMERGVAFEGDLNNGRVVFYAALIDQHRNPVAGFTPRRGITGGTSDGVSFLQATRQFDQYRLEFGTQVDGAATITTLRFVPGAVVNAGSANGILFLGITAAQLAALKALAGLDSRYPRTVCLEEVGAVGAGKKYKIGIQGLAANGAFARVMPSAESEIFVYSMEGLFYYSDAFSADEPLPTTYTRNTEEAVGQMNLPIPSPVNYAIHSVTVGAGGRFTVAGDLRQKITRGGKFQITGNPNNNGSYTAAGVAYAAAANLTTITVVTTNVTGPSTSGSLQLLPRPIEDHFIELDQAVISGTNPMKTIVDGFRVAVNVVANNAAARATLEGHIDNFGSQILARARAAVRYNGHANPDERPLYWARLKMGVILKSHEYLLQNIADRDALVKRFEERTRGITPAPSFAAAGANKKVLVIGFDPFFLVPGQAGHNPHQCNPGGVAALFFHGAVVEVPGVFFQSVIVPVRFDDFDAGLIDKLVDPLMQAGNAIDMVVSFNQDTDLRYHIDRFAALARNSTTADNAGVKGKNPVHYEMKAGQTALIRLASNANLPKYLETNLPVNLMVPGSNMPVAAAGTEVVKTVILDQKFKRIGAAEQGVDNIPIFSGTVPPPGTALEKGSCGNFFSNEILYRLLWRRTQRATTLKVGHIGMPMLQKPTPSEPYPLFDPARYRYHVDTVIQILKDAVK